MSLLEIWDIDVGLGGRRVLEGADLAVRAGERVALVGPNGAGKSSLIRAAAGLLPTTRGGVRLGGDDVRGLSSAERARRRAYLPQDRTLVWNMAAVQVAALGAPFVPLPQALARARIWLEALEIGHLADRGVAEMSGGERARVLLARALLSDAPLLLADEPIAGLDPDAQLLVLDILGARAKAGGAVVASLHDLPLAAAWADRVVVLDQGHVAADGPADQALTSDQLRTTFRLVAEWSPGPNPRLVVQSRASQ